MKASGGTDDAFRHHCGRTARARRVGSADDLRARTKADVLGAMGSPNARAELASGGEVLDWRVRGMHLTLMFDAGGQCVGVTRCSY
jgi:hypothetical protein